MVVVEILVEDGERPPQLFTFKHDSIGELTLPKRGSPMAFKRNDGSVVKLFVQEATIEEDNEETRISIKLTNYLKE